MALCGQAHCLLAPQGPAQAAPLRQQQSHHQRLQGMQAPPGCWAPLRDRCLHRLLRLHCQHLRPWLPWRLGVGCACMHHPHCLLALRGPAQGRWPPHLWHPA